MCTIKNGEVFFETQSPTFEKLKQEYPDAELLEERDIEWNARLIKMTPTKFFLGYHYADDSPQSQIFHLIEGEFCEVFKIDRLWVSDYDEKFVFEYVEDLVNSCMTGALEFLSAKFNGNNTFITSSTSGTFSDPKKLFELFME